MRVTNRALLLAEAVRQSKAYLRRYARTLPPAVVIQLKADLARNERELAELEAENRSAKQATAGTLRGKMIAKAMMRERPRLQFILPERCRS